MCCATANNSSEATEEKESARSIFTAILLCLIEEKRSIISSETKEVEGKEKKNISFWYSTITSMQL